MIPFFRLPAGQSHKNIYLYSKNFGMISCTQNQLSSMLIMSEKQPQSLKKVQRFIINSNSFCLKSAHILAWSIVGKVSLQARWPS